MEMKEVAQIIAEQAVKARREWLAEPIDEWTETMTDEWADENRDFAEERFNEQLMREK